MILYFSGTGNSRFAAETIGVVTGDQVVSMSDLLKSGNKEPLQSDRPFVFVCPIYAWQIPKIVKDFIQQTPFEGSREAYFVLTCGSGTGNTVHYIKRLCRGKGFGLKGLAAVVMPISR
jgi:flavodoxin